MQLWGRRQGLGTLFGLTSPCLQEASAFVSALRNESMSRAGTEMQAVHAMLLFGVSLMALPSGSTAQTCTTGSKAVAVSAGVLHSCALLVSRSPPLR